MKAIHWKSRCPPEASWTAYSPGEGGVAQPVLAAESKDEMAIKLAATGCEFDGLDPGDPDSNGAIGVWTVRKFPENSLERNGERLTGISP